MKKCFICKDNGNKTYKVLFCNDGNLETTGRILTEFYANGAKDIFDKNINIRSLGNSIGSTSFYDDKDTGNEMNMEQLFWESDNSNVNVLYFYDSGDWFFMPNIKKNLSKKRMYKMKNVKEVLKKIDNLYKF